ncbi:hypothetical protein TSUD_01310 [Trifolium subterraneum]|nr:hypothetical protein TSUD_01310 [Trifolium subterraneum]
MASSTSSSIPNKVTLKLLIDTKNEKVLFAEASKAVIDFLFNLLRLPVGTVVKLLSKDGMDQTKDVLLNPRAPVSSNQISCLLPANDEATNNNVEAGGTLLYRCASSCSFRVTFDSTTLCPNCRRAMTVQVDYVGKKVVEENVSVQNGFVKDVVTFMVMDDLVVQPMSTISSITLLNKFNIKEVGSLQEKVVEMGMDEGIKLLKASLQSKTVLTTVFIKKDI